MTTYFQSLLWKLLPGHCRCCYHPLCRKPESHKEEITPLLPPLGPRLSLSDNHCASGDTSLVAPESTEKTSRQPQRFVFSQCQRWDYMMTTPINLCATPLPPPILPKAHDGLSLFPTCIWSRRWIQWGDGRIIGGRYIGIRYGYWGWYWSRVWLLVCSDVFLTLVRFFFLVIPLFSMMPIYSNLIPSSYTDQPSRPPPFPSYQ